MFNGDLGWVLGVDLAPGRLTVSFEEAGVDYDFSELDELQPSFAMNVHRAQGSEFPALVVPVLTQHYPMLQRNLLYTAITRGRRLVVVIGSRRALARRCETTVPGSAIRCSGYGFQGRGQVTGRRYSKPESTERLKLGLLFERLVGWEGQRWNHWPGEWGNGGLEWPWVIQTVGRQSAEDPR